MNRKTWKDVISLDRGYESIPRVNIRDRIVISMTTIPSRLDKLAPTLSSLLSQSRRVDEIRLNIPYKTMKGEQYKIPEYFDELEHIKIYRITKDYGPSSKLLPTVKDEASNTNIVVVDDDMIYGSRLVQMLANIFKKCGEKAVITNYGCNRHDNKITRMYNYFSGEKRVYLLFGCGGYILKASMIPEEIYDYDNGPPEAKYVDDNWISGWLWCKGIPVYSLGMYPGSVYIPNISATGTISLCKTANYDRSNGLIVDQWFQTKCNNKNDICHVNI